MEFFDNLSDSFGTAKPFAKRYAIKVNGDESGLFSFVLGISRFSSTEIVLNIRGGSILVVGEKMFIGRYSEGDVLICGKITNITIN